MNEENCRSRVMHLVKSSCFFFRLEPKLSAISFQIISSLVVVSFDLFPLSTAVGRRVLYDRGVRHVSPSSIMYDAHADLVFEFGSPFLSRCVLFGLSPLLYLVFQRLEANVLQPLMRARNGEDPSLG